MENTTVIPPVVLGSDSNLLNRYSIISLPINSSFFTSSSA